MSCEEAGVTSTCVDEDSSIFFPAVRVMGVPMNSYRRSLNLSADEGDVPVNVFALRIRTMTSVKGPGVPRNEMPENACGDCALTGRRRLDVRGICHDD